MVKVHLAFALIDRNFLDLLFLFFELKLSSLLLLQLLSLFERLFKPWLSFTNFWPTFFRVEKLNDFLSLVLSQVRVLSKWLESLHVLHSGLLFHLREGLLKDLKYPHEYSIELFMALRLHLLFSLLLWSIWKRDKKSEALTFCVVYQEKLASLWSQAKVETRLAQL